MWLAAADTSASAFANAAPVAAPMAPTTTLVLCVLAAMGTWLLMPKAGRSNSTRITGAGMAIIAGATLMILMIRWAAVASGATAVYFWVFAAITIGGAIRVITHKLPVYSALYFVLTVFSSAGLFVLLWAEFLAAALVLVYAGAILVVYIFVIMLAAEASGKGLISHVVGEDDQSNARSPLLACLSGYLVMGLLLFVIFDKAVAIPKHGPVSVRDPSLIAPPVEGQVQQLGVFLFTHQIVSVLLAGVILTLAMVGAIMIARKRVLLSDEDQIDDLELQTAPMTPADDNPHSISVEGEVGPRARSAREMAEI